MITQALDDAGWEQTLLDALPTIDSAAFRLVPLGIRHLPAEVVWDFGDDGIGITIQYRRLVFDLDAGIGINQDFIPLPGKIGYERLAITAAVLPQVAPDGSITLALTQADVELSDAIVDLGPFQGGGVLEQLLDGIGDLLAGLGDLLLGLVLGIAGEIPLGGPLDLSTDLLGSPMEISLGDIGTDTEGLTLALGVGLGVPVPDPLRVRAPTLEEGGPQADLTLALHEGLFQSLLQSELLALLEQDLRLGGIFGGGLDLVFTSLPGGGYAPDADEWCLKVTPGEARLARMEPSLDRMATLYFPDLRVDVAISHDGRTCDPWLEASLALEIGFAVDGTALDLDLSAPDGAVLFYATEGDWAEEDVVAGLGGLFDILLNLAGGALEIDLATLLGATSLLPGVEGAEPRILGIYPMVDAAGVPREGLYAISLDLF